MEIAVNEWLLHYLVPGSIHLGNAFKFLDALERRGDRMAIRYDSPWTRKLYRISKASYVHAQALRRIAMMLHDEARVHLVYEDEIVPLPDGVECPADDRYLVELAYSVPNKTILTTDNPLREALRKYDLVTVLLVEDFLPTYVT